MFELGARHKLYYITGHCTSVTDSTIVCPQIKETLEEAGATEEEAEQMIAQEHTFEEVMEEQQEVRCVACVAGLWFGLA